MGWRGWGGEAEGDVALSLKSCRAVMCLYLLTFSTRYAGLYRDKLFNRIDIAIEELGNQIISFEFHVTHIRYNF